MLQRESDKGSKGGQVPEVSVSRSDLVSRMFNWLCANKNDEIEVQIKSSHHHRNRGNS